jgi:cytochrome c biogenesis protein
MRVRLSGEEGDMSAKPVSVWRKAWQLLSSIKTGVVLLIVVVIVSAAGTLILQRPMTDPDEMQRAYAPQVLRILDALGLTNVFHAWWFLALLVMISVTIVAASIDRFPNAWRYYDRPYKNTDESFRRAVVIHREIAIPSEEAGIRAAEQALRKSRFKPERVIGAKGTSLFAEKSRISEMAVYIVHASLLLIFLGGIVDGVFGWTGFVSLVRGQQVTQLALRDGASKALPFAVRCDGAGQENYADGSPKKWWSNLAVLENGREVLQKQIVVNDPLVYRGVRFYQASYGMSGDLDKLLVTATSKNGNARPQDIELRPDQTVPLDPETSVRLARFIPDYVVNDGQVYSRSREPDNPAAQLIVRSRKLGKETEVWLPAIPGFAHNEDAPYSFEPKDLQMTYFTGLQVSHEPGQWGVWAGCLLMGLGLAAAFYLVHMRIWAVTLKDSRGRPYLWIGGIANKNRSVFEEKFASLVQHLETELKQADETSTGSRLENRAEVLIGN